MIARTGIILSGFIFCAALVAAGTPCRAQDNPATETQEPAAIEIQTRDIAPVETPSENMRSLFYTAKEHKNLLDALRRRIPPERRRLMGAGGDDVDVSQLEGEVIRKKEPEAPPPRILHLSGLIYTASDDWKLWLNGTQIVPGKVPESVSALNVTRDYIDMKWYDKVTGEVIPVRLRAHQRFNIDTKTFMTGAAPAQQPPAPVAPEAP